MTAPLNKAFREAYEQPVPTPVVLTAAALINAQFPPLEQYLSPWLPQKCLAMVHSKRGVGKTHFALAVADAVAAGGEYLGWKAPQPRQVLLIDGEMPVQLMQRRLSDQARTRGSASENLHIVTPDPQDSPMPDLGTVWGQAAVDAIVDRLKIELIIIDNISCLVRSGGAENEAESWSIVSEWAMAHRRKGRSILFLHHSGKSGAQRGTSRREDLLDVVIGLRRPAEYRDEDGAVFEIHFEKARSLIGDDVAPLEARLQSDIDGAVSWAHRRVEAIRTSAITKLWDGGGLNLTDIARELGIHKSTAHRALAQAMADGELKRDYPQKPRSKT